MTNVASLGFDIDTRSLTRANTELNKLIANATRAERAASSFGARASSAGAAAAAAMSRAANAAQGAAVAINAGANASATAATRAAAAQANAAVATRNATTATLAAVAANNNHAGSASRAANANALLTTSFLGLNASTILSVAALTLVAKEVGKMMDSYTQLQNTLKIANIVGQESVVVQERLFEAAIKNGVAIDDLTQFYRRASITQKEVGASNADMVRVSEAVAAALRVQGTSSKAAAGALLQLSQSFGSGKVKAEEFNSIQEGALPLLKAAATQIERYGGNVAKMRADVIAGTLTSKEFFEAIVKGANDLEKLAGSTKLTLSQSWTAAGNALTNFLGKLDNAADISKTVSSALEEVGKWLDALSKDQDFLSGLSAAFQGFSAIVSTVTNAVIGLINTIKSLAATIRDMLRDAMADSTLQGGITTDGSGQFVKMKGLKDYNKELQEATENTTKWARLINKLQDEQAFREKAGGNVTGAAKAQLEEAKRQYQESYQIYQLIKRDRENLMVKAFSERLGAPTDVPPGVTLEQFGPFLPDTTRTAGASVTGKKGSGNRVEDAYKKIQQNALQYIETLKLEEEQLGRTDEAANRATIQMDLLHKVQDANIPVTKQVTEWVEKMADAMAKAKTSLDVAKLIQNNTDATQDFVRQQQIEFDVLGMSREAATAYRKEQEALIAITKGGRAVSEDQKRVIKENALAYASAEEKVRFYTEALEFAKDIAKGFFSDMREALINGRSLWESFGTAAINVLNRIADKLVNMAIDGLFAEAFGSGRSSVSGPSSGGFGGILSGLSSGWGQFSSWAGFGPQSADSLMGLTSPGIFGTGISAGSAIGALGGVTSGIMGLMRGGTGGTIQGVSGLLGAGASFIPGIGPFLGPAISLLGGLFGGLLGETKPTITNQEYGQLSYGAGGFSTTGGAWGPNANVSNLTGPLGQIGTTIDSIFNILGGVKDAAKVWGVAMTSFSQQYGGGGSFSSATSYIVGPNGQRMQWGQGSNAGDIGMEAAGVQAAIMSILEGAVGEITGNMATAVRNVHQIKGGRATLEDLSNTVIEIQAFDKTLSTFGRDVPEVENALAQLNATFDALNNVVTKYNLSAEQTVLIEQERIRQQNKLVGDFKYAINQGILQFDNPLQAALNELEKQKEADIATNLAFLREVVGYEDQRHAIEVLYLKRRNEAIEQYNNGALGSQQELFKALDELIKSYMPGGSLAGESPAAHLAGLQTNYNTLRGQALANPLDKNVVDQFIQASQELATFAKDFYANDLRFVAQRDQLIADARALQSAGGGSGSFYTGQSVATSNEEQISQLILTVESLAKQNQESQATVAALTAKIDRILADAGK